jgi:hypothetical protein
VLVLAMACQSPLIALMQQRALNRDVVASVILARALRSTQQ